MSRKRLEILISGYNPLEYLDKRVGAYTLEHQSTGKQYHGSTKNIVRRKSEHKNDLALDKHGNKALQELVKQNPVLILSFTPAESVDEALKLEQEKIDSTPRERLLNRSLDTGNVMAGLWKNPEARNKLTKSRIGNTNAVGAKFSEEEKVKRRERLKGNQHALGLKHSEETLLKMSRSHQGRKIPQEYIDKSAEGRTRYRVEVDNVEYSNSAAAAKVIGVTRSCVETRCESDKFPNYKRTPK